MSNGSRFDAEARLISTLFGLLFATAALGTAAASVALPDLAEALDVSHGLSAWAVSLHALSMAVATLVYGRFMDLRGPRAPLAIGVALMAGGALVAALSSQFEVMILARLVQGAGAAAVPTIGMAVLSARYERATRHAALGRLAAVVAAATAGGAFIGGAVEAVMGWRAVIALPALGLLVVPWVWSALDGRGNGERPDVVGALLVALSSGGLVLLVQSPSAGLGAAALGGVLLAGGLPLVALWVRGHPQGFLPQDVITDATVLRSSIAAAAVPLGWLACQVAIPGVLISDGWRPWQVGILLLPSVIFAFASPRLAVPLLERCGERTTLRLAGAVASVALGAAGVGAWCLESAPVLASCLLLLGMALVSMAFGLSQPAVAGAISFAVPAAQRGVALGVASLIMLLAASLGAATISGVGATLGLGWALSLLAVLPMLSIVLAPARSNKALEVS